jgi:hypothetical protein
VGRAGITFVEAMGRHENEGERVCSRDDLKAHRFVCVRSG